MWEISTHSDKMDTPERSKIGSTPLSTFQVTGMSGVMLGFGCKIGFHFIGMVKVVLLWVINWFSQGGLDGSRVLCFSALLEDSPVFNFINSLSPIRPVKSVDSLHSVPSYLPSISSIFTSPHANLQREPKFLIRNSFLDFSKHESSSYNVDESNLGTGILNVLDYSDALALHKKIVV
uniref:Uncharacterized protein LOC105034124 n=1 Tax=Elaeis guineensis var. tenera TaxID=51953 RepID=A0A6I9QET2_ELAGV|nr:uncharacterized protein LOC105034124 [Elaeis guineensis]